MSTHSQNICWFDANGSWNELFMIAKLNFVTSSVYALHVSKWKSATEMFNEIIENGLEGNWIWRIVWLKLSPRVTHVISRRALKTVHIADIEYFPLKWNDILKCAMRTYIYSRQKWAKDLHREKIELGVAWQRLKFPWMLRTSSVWCVIIIYST